MMTAQIHDAQAPITALPAPHLTDEERAALLTCVNTVRAGEREFYVLVAYKKVTKARKRIAHQDYDPHKALAPNAHKGWLVAAPLNKDRKVYLHILDEARAQEPDQFGHTRVCPEGLLSFEVLRSRPGPLAPVEEPDPVEEPEPGAQAPEPQQFGPQQFGPEPQDPRLVWAQALMWQAKALMWQAQALMWQAQAQQGRPGP